jgi:hypothetical protein
MTEQEMPQLSLHLSLNSDIHSNMVGPDAFDASPKAPMTETASNHESVENGTIEEFGYTSIYRRVFAAFGNLCMVVSPAS